MPADSQVRSALADVWEGDAVRNRLGVRQVPAIMQSAQL